MSEHVPCLVLTFHYQFPVQFGIGEAKSICSDTHVFRVGSHRPVILPAYRDSNQFKWGYNIDHVLMYPGITQRLMGQHLSL